MQINLDKVEWKKWATEEELSGLIGIRSRQLRCIAERKRIRDRCYQRARRARDRTEAEPTPSRTNGE